MDVAVAIPSKSNEIYQMIEEVIKSLLSDVSSFHRVFHPDLQRTASLRRSGVSLHLAGRLPLSPQRSAFALLLAAAVHPHSQRPLYLDFPVSPIPYRHASARQQSRGRFEPSLRADSHRGAYLPHDSRRIPRQSVRNSIPRSVWN